MINNAQFVFCGIILGGFMLSIYLWEIFVNLIENTIVAYLLFHRLTLRNSKYYIAMFTSFVLFSSILVSYCNFYKSTLLQLCSPFFFFEWSLYFYVLEIHSLKKLLPAAFQVLWVYSQIRLHIQLRLSFLPVTFLLWLFRW